MAKSVLIVDDALIMRKRIADIAASAGWELAGEACDGEEALEMYERVRPDLVTLDIVMPRVDGVAALQRLRALDPSAWVVMISAVDQREKLTECIRCGASDFIVKPFNTERLRNFFAKCLDSERVIENG